MAFFEGSLLSDDKLRAEGNELTAVRLILAAGVIWTHCTGTLYGEHGVDEISRLVGLPISHLAVNGFFFLSGFLIARSVLAPGAGLLRFARMRFARIWPGLAICCLVTLLAFALLSPALLEYLLGGEAVRFLGLNLTLLKAAYELPDPAALSERLIVNGSLWTIPWEVRCYLGMTLIFALPAARRASGLRLALPAIVLAAAGWAIAKDIGGILPDLSRGALYNIDLLMRLGGCFAVGGVAALWHRRILLSWTALALLIAFGVAAHLLTDSSLLASPIIFYAVLCAGFARPAERAISPAWPDLSYGTYLYGFPVMLIVQALFAPAHHASFALLTLLATLPVAALSWYLVESPALRLARR